MPKPRGILTTLPALAPLVILNTGCTGVARMKSERDALYQQNQALQAELDSARSSFSDAPPQILEVPVAPLELDGSSFEGIADVEVSTNAAGELALRLPSDVLFNAGKASLRDAAKRSLREVAAVLQSEYPDRQIRVEGYTDSDPIRKSGWKDNLELSLARAAAVHRYLVGRGIPAERLYAAGYGSENPLQSKAASRRVEIVVVR